MLSPSSRLKGLELFKKVIRRVIMRIKERSKEINLFLKRALL
jgi:hypothetical protein